MKNMTEKQAEVILDFVSLCEKLGVKRLGPSDEVVQVAKDTIKKSRETSFHGGKDK